VEALAESALELIRASAQLSERFDFLVSIKGIATASAISILAELAVLPADMSARQWVAHSGLDPRQYQSGTSVSAPARISKHGNRHLRSCLFMPALVASQHEPSIRAFYQRLIVNGKKPMQALVAVMRKLLHIIYGMFRNQKPFDEQRVFV